MGDGPKINGQAPLAPVTNSQPTNATPASAKAAVSSAVQLSPEALAELAVHLRNRDHAKAIATVARESKVMALAVASDFGAIVRGDDDLDALGHTFQALRNPAPASVIKDPQKRLA